MAANYYCTLSQLSLWWSLDPEIDRVESKELAKVKLIDLVNRPSLKSSQPIQFCKVDFSHFGLPSL